MTVGGYCWYCHWGWPRAVHDIYARYERLIDDLPESPEEHADLPGGEQALKYGPGHVVWEDENWDCARWCVGQCDAPLYADWDRRVLDLVRQSLEELDALPDAAKYVRPAGYDGRRPEDYPPPPGVKMVRP